MQNITLREKMKKVSIIIPCYNQAAYICETVESALAQTYPYIEIICINDGSTENSAEIIEKLAQKEDRLLFLNEKENKGVVQARNIAISKSTGDYILPLDADDTIEPAYVEKAVDILENNPEIGIVYCKAQGRKSNPTETLHPSDISKTRWKQNSTILEKPTSAAGQV